MLTSRHTPEPGLHPIAAACENNDMPAREHVLETSLWLPVSRDRLFPFFADAANLNIITPPWVHFRILTPMPIEMRVGTLLDYRIRLRGFPIRWRTKITAWEPGVRFVDEQLKGPYYLWRHEHTFEDHNGGTLCRDKVTYAHPGGALVHRWLVGPDVARIFEYRQQRLLDLFGAASTDVTDSPGDPGDEPPGDQSDDQPQGQAPPATTLMSASTSV